MNEHRRRQILGVMRLELKKGLLGRRAIPIYVLGLIPVGMVILSVIVSSFFGVDPEFQGTGGAYLAFIMLFYMLILPVTVYFGCVWIFLNLFRGEVIDRSLHYYFLTPIRREVLAAGKYLSALAISVVVFGGSTAVCFLVIYGYLGGAAAGFGISEIGLLLRYLAGVVVACLGYGAVFLVVGLFLRNFIVPALIIFLIEFMAHPFLPAALQKVSIIFYLYGIVPLPAADGPFKILAEPVSPWIAIPGLILFTALTLFAASLRIRKMEIAYGAE
jgi:ABC-type transport system involved in multi-copper enzyme maturation permease subunit